MALTRRDSMAGLGSLALVGATALRAQADETTGVTETNIRIGQTTAYSGATSALQRDRQTEAGTFAMVNADGGIGGRKITLSDPRSFDRRDRARLFA